MGKDRRTSLGLDDWRNGGTVLEHVGTWLTKGWRSIGLTLEYWLCVGNVKELGEIDWDGDRDQETVDRKGKA